MPLTTGLADQTPMANVGKMKSYGWEGNIGFTQSIGQVNLQLRANFTYQTTDIIDKDEAANELWYKMDKGFQLNQSRGLIALGLFKDQDEIDRSPKQTSNRPILPGDIKYKDVNGDGVINDDDIVPLGYREVPGLQYGVGLSANWRNWNLSVLSKEQVNVISLLAVMGLMLSVVNVMVIFYRQWSMVIVGYPKKYQARLLLKSKCGLAAFDIWQ